MRAKKDVAAHVRVEKLSTRSCRCRGMTGLVVARARKRG